MPKPIKRLELVRKLKALGFNGPFSGGKHEFMKIGRDLLSQIIKDLDINAKDFEKL